VLHGIAAKCSVLQGVAVCFAGDAEEQGDADLLQCIAV